MSLSFSFDNTIYRYALLTDVIVPYGTYNGSSNPTWTKRFDDIREGYNDQLIANLYLYQQGTISYDSYSVEVENIKTLCETDMTTLKEIIYPYCTAIQLYDKDDDLIAIANLSQPIRMPSMNDRQNITFVVQIDL